jgi:ribonuclease HII
MTGPSRPGPDDVWERAVLAEGFGLVAGVDEVGRGAWAGPASVGVVVYRPDASPPEGLRDSKEVPEDQRELLYPLVTGWGVDWAVGHVGPDECDRLGMTAALRLAARRALGTLRVRPEVVLLDGPFDYISDPVVAPDGKAVRPEPPKRGRRRRAGQSTPPVRTVVDGDAICVSIAAASIVAKVTRDRLMREMAESFPPFDFDRNKGYPSPTHKTALAGHGLSSVHRRSWAFVEGMAFR